MSVGPMEIIIVLALALLIFGPKRLPEMGRTLGRAAREFRKASDEVKGVLNLGLNDDQETPGGTAAAVTAAAPPHTPGDGPWSPEDTAGRNGFAPAEGGPGAQALPGLAGFLGGFLGLTLGVGLGSALGFLGGRILTGGQGGGSDRAAFPQLLYFQSRLA